MGLRVALISFGHIDVILPLFRYLQASGLDIDLYLCFSLNRKSESVLDFSEKSVSPGFTDSTKTEELLGFEIRNYLGAFSKVRFFIFQNLKLRSRRNFYLSATLAKRLKQYDIIHFNGINAVLPVLMVFLKKKKLLFTIHDIKSHSGEKTRFNFAEKLIKYIIRSRYPLIIQNLKDFIFLNQKYPKISSKFKFIPFSVLDVYREFKTSAAKAPVSDLLFFGRISPYKGIEYLIDALEILDSKEIKVKTIIAGQGTIYFKSDNLEKLNIELINKYIKNNELVALIENTKVIVCPYTDATQSGVVMTAFAFNKPVIASAVGSFKEVVKDGITGILVPPRDSTALASKIEQLITDNDLLKQMMENIHKDSTDGEYSWTQIAYNTKEVYSKLISRLIC